MIKIIPIIFITFIFLVIFFIVKNLTSQIDNDFATKTSEENSIKLEKEQIKNSDNSVETLVKIEDKNQNKEQEKSSKPQSLNKNLIKKKDDKDDRIKEDLKVKNEITKNLEKKEKVGESQSSKKRVRKTENIKKLIKIQFGAFSKLKNAEKHKKYVTTILSKEFTDFYDKTKISNENSLFKVLHQSKSIDKANAICKFSRSKKISCLILKK